MPGLDKIFDEILVEVGVSVPELIFGRLPTTTTTTTRTR